MRLYVATCRDGLKGEPVLLGRLKFHTTQGPPFSPSLYETYFKVLAQEKLAFQSAVKHT